MSAPARPASTLLDDTCRLALTHALAAAGVQWVDDDDPVTAVAVDLHLLAAVRAMRVELERLESDLRSGLARRGVPAALSARALGVDESSEHAYRRRVGLRGQVSAQPAA